MSSLWMSFRWTPCLVLLGIAPFAATVEEPITPVLHVSGDSFRFAAKALGAAPTNRFTRAVTGFFNDDPLPDVVVRRRSRAHLFVDSTTWDAALAVPGMIRGMARLAGTAATGRDELLVTTSNGLRAWTRDSANGVFGSRALGNDLLWSNVELLISADLDGFNGADIVGVTAGGTQGLILLAGAGGVFASEIVFALPSPPLAVVACDLGGTGSKVIAFLGPTSVYVTSNEGSPRYTVPVPGSAVATVLRDGEGVAERVAWIASNGAGDVLRTFDGDLVLSEFPLGALDAVGIASWDFDLDGDDDALVSHRAGWNLKLLTHDDGAFDTVGPQSIPTGPTGAADTNSAWPAIADLDGDGDDDAFIPVQADEMIFVYLNGTIAHDLLMPRVVQPVLFNHGTYGGEVAHGYLQLEALDAFNVPPEATHVELAVWRKLDIATPTDDLPAQGFSFLFERGQPYETGILEYENPAPSVLFWALRYVVVAGGEVVRVFPSRIQAVTTESELMGGPVLAYLLSKGATVHGETLPDSSISGRPGFHNSRTTSTIVKLVPIVDYDEDREPSSGH